MRIRPFLFLMILEGCSPGTTALHAVPRPADERTDGAGFYDLPFPSDLRLRPDGSIDLSGYPRPGGQLDAYLRAMDGHIGGAGPSAAIHFRFDGPLDPGALPAGARESVSEDASAFVVDITEGSPTYGERSPVLARFHPEGGRFIGANWLALQPYPGVPLRERTTYAAVLTTSLSAASGPLLRHPDLDALLQDAAPADPALLAAWQRYAPLRAWLARRFRAGTVVGATVFTTQDATGFMLRLRRAVYERAPAPRVEELRYVRDHDGLCQIYRGTFLSPNFQTGDPPYLRAGGTIETDEAGQPRIARMERLRFAVSVPNAPMPEAGWPVALYAHGTGGDFESFTQDGTDLRAAYMEAEGRVAARMAVVSIDQVLHGPRDPSGTNPELTFFNFQNLAATRDNHRQAAADDFQLLRLVRAFAVEQAPVTGRPIRFDPRRTYFIGHSQGGSTGPLFLAAEPEVRAAVLSGAGAVLTLTLLDKTKPVDIPTIVSTVLQEPATPDHPFLALLQAYFEPADPNNYGRLLFREPPPGAVPKSVLQTLGITDHYTPVDNIKAFALSLGVQPVRPRLSDIEGLALTGMRWTDAPVRANVAGGRATGVLCQYPQKGNDDGHFVLFDQWDARHDLERFFSSDIAAGLAQLR